VTTVTRTVAVSRRYWRRRRAPEDALDVAEPIGAVTLSAPVVAARRHDPTSRSVPRSNRVGRPLKNSEFCAIVAPKPLPNTWTRRADRAGRRREQRDERRGKARRVEPVDSQQMLPTAS